VEEAIVLEDDCLPHATFFRFCSELLARYRHDPRVLSIAGSDFRFGLIETSDSYSASRYPLIWGWATWRRAWQQRAGHAEMEAALRRDWPGEFFADPHARDYWAYLLADTLQRRHTWDIPWAFSCWLRGGVALHPRCNLVSNIGFGPGATHTHDGGHALADLSVAPMAFPLRHPSSLVPDPAGESLIDQALFSGRIQQLWARVRRHRAAARDKAGR